jgi:hypothetical protein
MTRKIKALGLGLVAMLAFGAISASASAQDLLTVPNAPVTVTASGGGPGNGIFKVTTGIEPEVHCEHNTFDGTVTGPAVEEVTVSASYEGSEENPTGEPCDSSIGESTVRMNGCDYVLTGETTGSDGGNTDATVSIVCPGSEQIEIETPGTCTIHIHAQTSTSGGVTYTNGTGSNGEPDVTVHATVTGITYSTTGPLCFIGGLPTEGNQADYNETITVEAPEGIEVSS